MTKVLVTGGAGYIGSKLISALIQEKHTVRVFDIPEALKKPLLFAPLPSLETVPGDIKDTAKLPSLLQDVDVVVHLAALVRGGAAPGTTEASAMWEINYEATCRLADLCRIKGIERFLFISTCGNYGGADSNRLAKEEDALIVTSPYAETKIRAEEHILSNVNEQFHATVLRLATVFGSSPRMSFEPLINRLVYDAVVNKSLVVQGPNAWRPFVHIDDVVKAIVLTLRSPLDLVSGQVFNVGANSMNYTKADIVRILQQFVPDLAVELHGEDPRSYKVCFDKIAQILGFRTSKGLEEGVAEMVQLLKDARQHGNVL
ncbi:MAG: NAD(P)-dependent oxidoreductase [Chloroflexi bacterium]|nr:NAD(P)-dependent oxidoreductase [Chloroflexota bacterium]